MPPSGSGALSELQVGPADVLAGATMAHSAWGWIGGLRGLAALLRLAQDPSSRARVEAIFNSVEPDPTLCRVLAQDGLAILRTPDLGPFGETEAEKLVSLTMCALAHIMAPTSAVKVFMDHFAESLIVSGHWKKKNHGAKDALRVFLNDRLQAILNEGTARQLPARFDKAIADARLTTATIRKAPHPKHEKPVGYRSLVLVTGGSSETDSWIDGDNFVSITIDPVAHYRYETVGAMLWNAFYHGCNQHVEVLQQDFERLQRQVEKDLQLDWTYVGGTDAGEEITVFLSRTGSQGRANPIAVRLASLLFSGNIADMVAPYYQAIASEHHLGLFLEESKGKGKFAPVGKEFQRFQTIAASIYLSILGKLGGKGFWDMQHSTMLEISTNDSPRWLCGGVSAILEGGAPMSRVVGAVSAIHCATIVLKDDFLPVNTAGQGIDSEESVVVGWRKGKYAVLPSVLLTLPEAITKDMLSLRCVDEFIANVATRRDGQICSTISLPGAIRFSAELFEGFDTGDDVIQNRLVRRQYNPITLGAPVAAKPDRHLYLNLEQSPRDLGSTEPDICLCGRLDGETLGHVSIQDVLCTLALSWTDDEGYDYPFCTTAEHETTDLQTTSKARPAGTVYNMAVGTFFERPGVMPKCKTDAEDRYHVSLDSRPLMSDR
ncbi:hypothetical protein CC79DRAFT_1353401, partial [Sarocladium strictum]